MNGRECVSLYLIKTRGLGLGEGSVRFEAKSVENSVENLNLIV